VSDGVNVLYVCEACGAMFFTEVDMKGHVEAHVKGLLKHRKPPPVEAHVKGSLKHRKPPPKPGG